MLLGFDEYHQSNKHPSASPSVSSPDSHNSDSSVEVGDRRQSLLRQTQAPSRDQLPPPHLNKELFLPLSFPGLMPPPGFMPPSQLMFPGYHPALYAQHQGLLKPAIDPAVLLSSTLNLANNNCRFTNNNNNNKSAEELTKRYLDAVLNSQRLPRDATVKSEDGSEDMDNEDIVVSETPPRSPVSRDGSHVSHASHASHASRASRHSSPDTHYSATTPPPPPTSAQGGQDIPIDLSMKTKACPSPNSNVQTKNNLYGNVFQILIDNT